MFLSPNEIEEEKNSYTNKPTVYKNNLGFPYNDLTDREFEVLLYSIYKEEINSGELDGQFDSINLMQGIGERGRDCTLHYKGDVVGAIQCKKYNNRVNKPELAREIIKFALHYILDKRLITNPARFSYFFSVSNDFTEPALNLLNNFNSQICNEADFISWTKEVIKGYKAFKNISFEVIREDLITFLQSINVFKITASDLNIKLNKFPNLVSFFFEIEKVVSIEDNKNMINSVINPIPKLIELDEFKKRLIKKSTKLPFSNILVGRDNDLSNLTEQVLKGRKIIIIDGLPGVGKTRFTIELSEQILDKGNYNNILVVNDSIYNSITPLLNELNKNIKYILIVDDANRIENLRELKELLFNHTLHTEPVIILNVRSYNLDIVTKEVKSWGIDSIVKLHLKRLKNIEIDTMLQEEPFGITNEAQRKDIILTCKGNPRLAAIMAEVIKKDGLIIDRKPFTLFENYFEGVFTELVSLIEENYKTKAFLALVATLRTIQLDDTNLITNVKETLKFDNDLEFNNSMNVLHECEIIELSPYNSTIKIFDDSVSEYILYRYVMADTKEVINFEEIFEIFHATHASNIIENLVALILKGYESEKLKKIIYNLSHKTFDILIGDEHDQIKLKYLDLMTKYVRTCPKECFQSVYHYWKTKRSFISDDQAKIIVEICKGVFYQSWNTHLRFVVEFLKEIIVYKQLPQAKESAQDFLSNVFKYYPPQEQEGKYWWFYGFQEVILEIIERWLTKKITDEELNLVLNITSQLCKNYFSDDYMDYIEKDKFIMYSGELQVTDKLLKIRTRTFKLLIGLFKEEWIHDIQRLEIIKILSLPFERLPHYGKAPNQELLIFDGNLILQGIEEFAKYNDNQLIESKMYGLIYEINRNYKLEQATLLLTKLKNDKLAKFEKVEGSYWRRGDEDWEKVEKEKEEYYRDVAKEVTATNYVEFLNQFALWQSQFLMDKQSYVSGIGDILYNLGEENPALGSRIIDKLEDERYFLLKGYVGGLLTGIGKNNSYLKREICLKLMLNNDTEYCRAIASSYAWNNQQAVEVEDIQLFTLLIDFNDEFVDHYLVNALRYYQHVDTHFIQNSLRIIIGRCKTASYSELLKLIQPQKNRNNYEFFKTNIDFFKELVFGTIRVDCIFKCSLDYYLSQCLKYLVKLDGIKVFLEYFQGRIKQKELIHSYKYNLLSSNNGYFMFINQTEGFDGLLKELMNNLSKSTIKEDLIDLIVELIGNDVKYTHLFIGLLEDNEKWIDIVIDIVKKLPTTPAWFDVVEALTLKCYDIEKLIKLYSAFSPSSYWGSGIEVYQNILDNITLNKQRFSSYEMLSFLKGAEDKFRSIVKSRKERVELDEEYI
ncbi:hypothetical protein [Priestia aryabhattai]|uniref:hypothetical protein n=1 Tax=Priestia aryabhattai TaxID=412384 RepID=UPI003B66EC4A